MGSEEPEDVGGGAVVELGVGGGVSRALFVGAGAAPDPPPVSELSIVNGQKLGHQEVCLG